MRLHLTPKRRAGDKVLGLYGLGDTGRSIVP